MFVTAKIHGHHVDDVFVVPREALRGENQLLIVGPDERIQIRRVEILRIHEGDVFVRGGLEPGERLCRTRLETYSEQMQVRIANAPAERRER